MEKDSFENLLRNKVLQAESAIHQSSDKESVWRAIQKKQQPKRKLYYAAAAIFFLLALVSVLYVKQDKTIAIVAKAKQSRKPVANDLPKQQILQQSAVMEQAAVPIKTARSEQIVAAVKQIENAEQTPENNTPKEVFAIVVQQKVVELVTTIAINNTENKTTSIEVLSVVPEFTVQFKRGTSMVKNTNESLMITSLKKFKLKRDTTYFANAVEKQPNKMKLTFKKEN